MFIEMRVGQFLWLNITSQNEIFTWRVIYFWHSIRVYRKYHDSNQDKTANNFIIEKYKESIIGVENLHF